MHCKSAFHCYRVIGCLMISLSLLVPAVCLAQKSKKEKPPTRVFAHQVSQQSFSNTLQALGTLRANEATTISSSVTETVTAIHFSDGQRVAVGDILVEMASAEEHALLEQAQFTLKEAEQQYLRVQSLIKTNIATQSELDQRRLAFDSAKSLLDATRSRLNDLLIIAPFSGVVGLRDISLGALVRPGDIITTLDDDSIMKLDMSVPSIYLPYLQTGMSIKGKAHALGDRVFEGEISSIGSRVDPISRSIQVRALIPNPERILKPGLLMIVELEQPARMVIVVPEKTIIQSSTDTYVYVVVGDAGAQNVERRDVQTGGRKPGIIEIVSGLNVGERIITQGHLKLKDGAKVNVVANDNGTDHLTTLLGSSATSAPSNTEGQ